ncbi:MAG TPA: methyltransferase domain-containing protein [Gemmataceae bacterium]
MVGTQPTAAGATPASPNGRYADVYPSLLPFSNTLGHPAVARPGLLRLPIRLIRKALKGFFRPWLEYQTRFNHCVIQTLHHNQAVLADDLARLGEQLQARDQPFAELSARVADLANLGRRLEEGLRRLGEDLEENRLAALHAARIQESRWDERLEQAESRWGERLRQAEHDREQRARESEESAAAAWRQRLDEALQEAEARCQQRLTRAEQERHLRAQEAEERAVNRELSHEGRIAQAGLFFNPPVHVGLAEGRGKVFGISERILEHIYVHSRLPKPPARVLDLGCAESTNAIEMASLGFEVVGVDLRLLPLTHPNFRMVQADLADLPFPDDSFDVAVSLSTIEHVGLKWYGEPGEQTTDARAVEEVYRVLKPGGTFILTVPFGRAGETPLHRIYDRAGLERLLHRFRWVEVAYGLREGNNWVYSTDAERAEATESIPKVSAIAMLVVEKA